MTIRRDVALLLLTLCSMVPFQSASAAVLTLDIEVSASDFSASAPIDPFFLNFRITFDTTQNYSSETSGITLNALNISFTDTIAFSYTASNGSFSVGGVTNDVDIPSRGTNDFQVQIANLSTTPILTAVLYAQASDPSTVFVSTTGSLNVSSVPEPGTLALLGAGVMGAVAMRVRKRRRALML